MYGNTKADATREAKKTLSLLKNKKGWKIVVWENLGWCFCLEKGGLSLWGHDYGSGMKYSCLLSNNHPHAGEMYWSDHFSSKNPNKAVEHQLKLATDFLKLCVQTINKAKF